MDLVKKRTRSMIIATLMVFVLSAGVCAASYTNKVSFSNIKLPHEYGNVTAATGTKTTDRAYGKVQITKIGGNSAGVNCWYRSKSSNGNWDSLESKLVSFTSPGTKTLYYKNSSTGYTIPHGKGVTAQLRMENKTNTLVVKDKASGYCWFN